MEEYMFLLSVLCWHRSKSEPFNVTLLFLFRHILLFMILFHSCILPFSVISTRDQDFSTDGTNMSTLIWCHVRLIGWIAHFVLKNGFFSTFSFNCFNSSTAHKWFPNVSLLLWYEALTWKSLWTASIGVSGPNSMPWPWWILIDHSKG